MTTFGTLARMRLPSPGSARARRRPLFLALWLLVAIGAVPLTPAPGFATDAAGLRSLRTAATRPGASDSLRYAAAVELGTSDEIADRVLALDLLDEIRFAHRDDPQFHRARARVLEASNQPARAREALGDVLKLRPDDVEARVALAELWLLELLRHYDLTLTDRMLEPLRSALKDDPDNGQAQFLAALALELKGSVDGASDAARLEEGIRFAERLLAAHPANAEARFLLAVLRLDLGQVDESWRQFELALDGCDEEWRTALASLRLTAPHEAVAKLATADSSLTARYAKAYWDYHDPTPLTVVNENRLEIARRVILAEFLFGNTDRGVRGWDTAPGEAFIRYGPPKAHTFDPGQIVVGSAPWDTYLRFEPSAILWVYRFRNLDLRLKFEDVTCNYNYLPSNQTAQALSVLRKKTPVIFQEAPPGEIRQIYLDSGSSATGLASRVRQSVRLGVPLWRDTGNLSWLSETRLEIVVKDSTRTVYRRSQRRASPADVHHLLGDQGVLLMSTDFELAPGRYTVTAFVEDLDRKVHGVTTRPIEVRSFGRRQDLDISDPELTLDPGDAAAPPAAERHGVRFVPNPIGVVGDDRRLNLFYEIYGLSQEQGFTRHEVRYTVLPREYALEHERYRLRGELPPGDDLVTRVAAGLSLGGYNLAEENSLDVVFPEQRSVVAGTGLPRATRVGIPNLSPGDYVLIVTVHDLVADTSQSARAPFQLLPDTEIRELLAAARKR